MHIVQHWYRRLVGEPIQRQRRGNSGRTSKRAEGGHPERDSYHEYGIAVGERRADLAAENRASQDQRHGHREKVSGTISGEWERGELGPKGDGGN